jgi:hypothetical protein
LGVGNGKEPPRGQVESIWKVYFDERIVSVELIAVRRLDI